MGSAGVHHEEGWPTLQARLDQTRSMLSREHHPEFKTNKSDQKVNTAICKIHLDAAEVSRKMADIHYNLALIKTKVSPERFIQISMSVPLPLTTVQIVDQAKPRGIDVDTCTYVTTCQIPTDSLVTKLQYCPGQVHNAEPIMLNAR